MSVSVVVPVYRSADTLLELVARTRQALAGSEFEIILVEDAGGDESWTVVQELSCEFEEVRGLRMGRNAGQHSALLAGTRAATYGVVVTIDDDLQNPPEEIPTLVDVLMSGDADVVYGVPSDVAQAGWRRVSSQVVRRSMKAALGVDEVVNMSSFRAFHTRLRDAFDVRLGPGVSLDALLAWATDRFIAVQVRHDARVHGSSNYSFSKLVRFALDTLTGYTTLPLRLVSGLGFLTAVAGLILMVTNVLIPAVRGISIEGFPFLASIIILFSGIQLITLGVIGEYLARMHFRIMNKPEYVVAENIDGQVESADNG